MFFPFSQVNNSNFDLDLLSICLDPGIPCKNYPFPTRFRRGFASNLWESSFWEKKNQPSTLSPSSSSTTLIFFVGTPKTQQFVSLWRLCQWPAQPFCLKRLGTKYRNFRVSAAGVESSIPETRAASHAPLALWPRSSCVTFHSTLNGISKGGKASQILPSNFVTSSTLGRKEMAGSFDKAIKPHGVEELVWSCNFFVGQFICKRNRNR